MANIQSGRFYSKSQQATAYVKTTTVKTNNVEFINKPVAFTKMSDLFKNIPAESTLHCVYGQTQELYRNIESGKTYTITWGAQTYTKICETFLNVETIGNKHIISSEQENTGEPFVYVKSKESCGNDLWIVESAPSQLYDDTLMLKVKGDAQTISPISSDILPNGNVSNGTGYQSSVSGIQNHTYGAYSQAEGWNAKTTGGAVAAHAEGIGTVATTLGQHVEGRNNLLDTSNNLAHIIGNGTDTNRSNAATVDFAGNAWFSGDVYVGSTSGVRKDEGSKKLATEDYVDQQGGKIQSISVNNEPQPIVDKSVNITVPTKTSQITNDSGFLTQHQDISGKQDKQDAQLTTTNKTVVGAINELKSSIKTNVVSDVTINGTSVVESSVAKVYYNTSISGDSDNAATTTAIRNFVNSSIEANAAYYITSDEDGNAFGTRASLISGPWYYSGEQKTPKKSDYAIVLQDEQHGNVSTRYIYTTSQWAYQYSLNGQFTQAQIDAMNSGITSDKIEYYDGYLEDIELFKLDCAEIADWYSETKAYNVGDYCMVIDDGLYRCISAIASPGEEWNEDHWEKKLVSECFGQGGSGTADYTQLSNKPKINGVELSGNKSLDNLGIQSKVTNSNKLPYDLISNTPQRMYAVNKTDDMNSQVGIDDSGYLWYKNQQASISHGYIIY